MLRAIAFLAGSTLLFAGEDPAKWLAIARETAPEFFAATVLKLAQDGQLVHAPNGRESMEEAFALAGRAEERVQLVGMQGLAADTRASHRVLAGMLHLDTVSLQSGLAVAMVRLDRVRGRELFERVERGPVVPRPCEEPLVADGSVYYRAAAEVLRIGFTQAERDKELHLKFVSAIAARIDSPSDAAAFAELLASLEWRAAELDVLLGEFGSKLDSIAPDYRSFGFSFRRLTAALSRMEARPALKRSLQRFVTAEETGPRCEENYTVSDLSLAAKPASRGAAFAAESYSLLAGSKEIEEEFAALSVSPEGPLSETERSSEEWRLLLAEFVSAFEAWQPAGEPIDVFHQKADYWKGLIEVTPAGEARDDLLRRAGSFLAASRVVGEHPAEWLWQVKQMEAAAGADGEKLRGAFLSSGSPELRFYCFFSGKKGG